nr:MAG TPA: zinc finger protein [Caudoviricetes sp.]
MKQCCGTCAYQHFENISDGWVCCNEKSDYRADWTGYEDSCKELEEKDDGE